jgi:serine/threonine protein kinase/cell division protein FtsN
MGVVYKVHDLETNEIVALKVLKPGTASNLALQESLRREVCLARKVTHKNVCRIHEFNRSNGTACISMEFIEGESLSSRLRRIALFPPREAVEIVRQICGGLREAHLQGIVHRDLKPANIIVDRSGNVKIMDFGIARLVRDNTKLTRTISGTPAYMAPEQIELKNVDARTDIYAVGLLLYEMVTGCPAFFGENPIAVAVKQIRDLPTRPREILPTLAVHTEAIILKCLQKDPAKRFQSVDELDLALRKEAEAKPVAKSWDSIVPQLQQAGIKIQQLLHTGIKEARPALSWWALELRREGRELQRIARGCVQKIRIFLEQRDWWVITRTRSQQALGGLALVLVLGCVIAFVLARSGKSGNATLAQPLVAVTAQSSQSRSIRSLIRRDSNLPNQPLAFDQDMPLAAGGTSPISTQKVDLNRGAELPSPKTLLSPPMVRGQVSVQLQARTNSSQDNASRSRAGGLHRPPVAVVAPASNLASSATSSTQTVEAKLDTLEATPLPLDSTLQLADVTNESKPVDLRPGLPLYFLEVGSFKDSTWADSAVEKLSQLGFHAVSVQKGHLWVQSYHVQVGPYTSPKDIDDAQQSLASHGFKSHLVK